jgi:hypothetical protein
MGEVRNMYKSSSGKLKERNHLEDTDGKIILKQILKEQDMMLCTVSIWLKMV